MIAWHAHPSQCTKQTLFTTFIDSTHFKTIVNTACLATSECFWVPSLLIQRNFLLRCQIRGVRMEIHRLQPRQYIYIYIIYTYLYIYLYRREELPKRSLLSICCQFCKFAWHAAFKRFEVKCVEPASACFLLSLWDVYVCMSLSFCRHVSLCMMGVWTYVCLCGCMDVCTYVYIFVCLYVFLSVRLYLSVYLCIYICQCMHICILAYMILIKEY